MTEYFATVSEYNSNVTAEMDHKPVACGVAGTEKESM